MIHRPQVLMVRTFSVVLLCGILLSACRSAGLVIEDAWVRAPVVAGGNGAGYLLVSNNGNQDDALIAVEADLRVP